MNLRSIGIHQKRIWQHLLLFSGMMVVSVSAATIQVDGVIEGPNSGPVGTVGETMDYLKFEVLTTSTIQIVGTNIGGGILYLAAYTGQSDGFGFLGDPYKLVDNYPSPSAPVLERTLNPGIYVVVVDDQHHSEYDVDDGFVSVNRFGGFFTKAPYSFEVIGDVQGLEFWEGQLDPQPYGSFKITTLPEPSAVLTLALAAVPFAIRRKRSVSP